MSAHPGIMWQPIVAAAGDIVGKRGQGFALLVGRAQWRIELGKAEPTGVGTQCGEHDARHTLPLQPGCDHDLERADGGRTHLSEPGSVSPANDFVPAAIGKTLLSGRTVGKSEGHVEGASDRPVGLGGIDGDQPVIEIMAELALSIIERSRRIVAHELGHGG